MVETDRANAAWLGAWLDSVARGAATMSQRAVSVLERHGGIAAAIAAAKARGLHLVELIDEKGTRLVAASRYPITTLC